MSVQTEADKHIEAAKENIKNAIRELSEVVIFECWGSSDFNESYTDSLKESLNSLLHLHSKLK